MQTFLLFVYGTFRAGESAGGAIPFESRGPTVERLKMDSFWRLEVVEVEYRSISS